MKIGAHTFDTPVILAPMAGVTDRPFRDLCYELGADLCVSEMVTSQKHLLKSRKTQLRLDHDGEKGIRSVQIAGTDPVQLAEAARYNVMHGAQIIDINMGCPAKKVCSVQAGSALLKNEKLVADILSSVVTSVDVPVTLKIRTGWDENNRNAVSIARIAEDNGIQALSVHGRTRADAFKGEAEYETIAEVKSATTIPIIANGDISCPEKARAVLDQTSADGLMIGRAAQGNPWIFNQIKHYLASNTLIEIPGTTEIGKTLISHLKNLHRFYGDDCGVRIARKHIGWYIKNNTDFSKPDIFSYDVETFRKLINRVDHPEEQVNLIADFFSLGSEAILSDDIQSNQLAA
jgi:tRNA-dihydrouridine synthase B